MVMRGCSVITRLLKRPVLVVAAIVAAGGCTGTPRTTDERALDADLAAWVQAGQRADHRIYSQHIDVDVERGEVHLKGFDLMGLGISQSSD